MQVFERRGSSFRGSTSHFTLVGDDIWKGLGDAGYRRGGEALVCTKNRVYALTAQGCVAYRSSFFGKGWTSRPTHCRLGQEENGFGVFFFQIGEREYRLLVEGDVIYSSQLKHTHSIRYSSFDAARGALQEKLRR